MAYLSNSTATMLDKQQQQQPYQSTWEESECEENAYQRGRVMMMGAPTTTNSGDETPMIPLNARRVSQEEFLAPAPSAMTKTTTSSSSCLGKHEYDSALISTTQKDAPSVHASKIPRTNFGTVPLAGVTATNTSLSTATKSTMTDFAYDPHDPSYIPVAPLLRHCSSIGMGLPLPPFLNATTSLGSLLGGLPLPPAPLLRAQSSTFSLAGSEARFAIAGGGGGANDVSEEDTAAAVSALLDLTPAVTSRHINHHIHIHGRTPLTELNRATSSDDSHDHQKASSNSNNSTSSTTTTTSNMPSLLPPAAAHGSTNDHQQTDNASTLVASIHHAAETASRLLVNVPISDKACKCKNTNCLKLYCACFSLGTLCDPKNCICKDCKNTDAFNGPNGDRTKAVGGILQRRFDAFDKTRPKKKTGAGCACKKTKCLKKYCDCFNNEVKCGDACVCTDCANTTLAEMTAQQWKNSTSSSSSPSASPQPV